MTFPHGSDGPNYCREARAYFAAMTVKPSAKRKKDLDRFIRGLIGAGLWTKFDFFHLLASHDAQAARVNLISPTIRAHTLNGSPTFAVNLGYTGIASGTDFLATGLNANTAGLKYVRDDAHMGIWSRTDLKQAATSSWDMGHLGVGYIGRSDSGSTFMIARVNTSGAVIDNSGYHPGHVGWERSASNAWASFANGVQKHNGTDASAALGADAISVLKAGASLGVNQIAADHMGSQLGATGWATLHALLRTLFVSIGAA